VEQLPGMVPLVDGGGDVDALVALQAQELTAGPPSEDLGELGLADARLALEEQRPVEPEREEDRGGEALVGQVSVLAECSLDVGYFDASSSPRRTSTRARWRRYSSLALMSADGDAS